MLRINKLRLVNFGPYYGEHELIFPEGKGIILIWGDNGYGKTTIMNAFRYVLWNKLINRKRQNINAFKYINLDSRNDGSIDKMLVEVSINYNGVNYLISRGLKYIGGSKDNPFSYETIGGVLREHNALSKEEGENLLNSILPERISRFYLFDGELLAEYEDLLDKTDDTDNIKRSIEDILGIPILENAKENLETIKDKFTSEASNLAKKQDRTKAISEELEKNTILLEEHKNNRKKLNTQLEDISDTIKDLSDKMKETESLRSLMDQRDSLIEDQKKDEEKSDNSWHFILNQVLTDSSVEIESSIEHLKEKEHLSETFEYVTSYLKDAFNENNSTCPICNNSISEDQKHNIFEHLKVSHSKLTDKELEDLKTGKYNVQFLKGCKSEDQSLLLINMLNNYEELNDEIALRKVRINTLDGQIKQIMIDNDEQSIKDIQKEYEKALNKKNEIENGIKDLDKDIGIVQAAIEKLSNALKKKSEDSEVEAAFRRKDLAVKLFNLFDCSISSFRDKLKEAVEKDATDIFRKISHEKGYDRLIINDNFGLEIVDHDGNIVPNRSSGYEQVVAISLISALHRNAPIAGPIFMDSNFQRVDEQHKLNILETLHSLADQVVILVYNKEFADRSEAKNQLGEHLIKEYEIQKDDVFKSSFN